MSNDSDYPTLRVISEGGVPTLAPPQGVMPNGMNIYPCAMNMSPPSYVNVPTRFKSDGDAFYKVAESLVRCQRKLSDLCYLSRPCVDYRLARDCLFLTVKAYDMMREHQIALAGWMLWSWNDAIITGRDDVVLALRDEHEESDIQGFIDTIIAQADQ